MGHNSRPDRRMYYNARGWKQIFWRRIPHWILPVLNFYKNKNLIDHWEFIELVFLQRTRKTSSGLIFDYFENISLSGILNTRGALPRPETWRNCLRKQARVSLFFPLLNCLIQKISSQNCQSSIKIICWKEASKWRKQGSESKIFLLSL